MTKIGSLTFDNHGRLVRECRCWDATGNWAEDLYSSEWKTKFTAVRINKWCKNTQRYGQRLRFEWEDEGQFHLQLWHVDEFQEQGRFFGMPLMFVDPSVLWAGV
jgi:hypothetical protein